MLYRNDRGRTVCIFPSGPVLRAKGCVLRSQTLTPANGLLLTQAGDRMANAGSHSGERAC